jgi:outer membrane protein assembly factor BamB
MKFQTCHNCTREAVLAISISVAVALTCPRSAAAPPAGKDREPKEPTKDARGQLQVVPVPSWKKTTIGLPAEDDVNGDTWRPARDYVAGWYARVLKERQESRRPTIPPAVPVGHSDFVTFMTDRTVSCCSLRPTALFGHPLKAGDIAWAGELDCGLLRIAGNLGPRTLVDSWMRQAKPETRCDAFFHRTLSTSVSISDGYAHTMDELAIVPLDGVIGPESEASLSAPLSFNSIKAIDLESGKLFTKQPEGDWNTLVPKKPRPKGFVLSSPLSKDGRWYLVCEIDGKVSARCFAWQKFAKLWQTREPNRIKDSTIWDTELAKPPDELWKDLFRRIHAIHVVLTGNLAICPTNLGRVVAVEEKTGKIKWTHEYAPLDAKRFPTFAPEWFVIPPVVAGDKYVYAPADFPELLCLNVADGKKVWSVKKGDGLFPAVVGDQVLVIGEKTVRSLSLKDGTEQWKLDLPGLPCGRGAVLGDTYLVPVSEPKTWRGMIAVVDLKAGKIAEVLKPEKDEPIGNLVVHQEFLISQTLTEIAVFPIKKRE